MTTGVVTFSADTFRSKFPEFASTISEGILTASFSEATLFINNTAKSRVANTDEREVLLYLVTAHLVYISQGKDGNGGSGLAGPLVSASEGSVSASAVTTGVCGRNAFWMQSVYGQRYWAATAKYRHARYLPGRSYSEVRRGF